MSKQVRHTTKKIKAIKSEGLKKVTNIYWDADTKQIVMEVED